MPVSGPTAAYLYILGLDAPGRAWEYLRRNAGYEADWRRHGRPQRDAAAARAVRRAEPWGLRFPGRSRARRPLGRTELAA